MKSKDVTIGMAVIPHDKTAGYFNFSQWRGAEELKEVPVLLVESWDKSERSWILTSMPLQDTEVGGMFHAKDFEPYTTPYKMVKFLDTGKEFRQFQVGDLQVYRFMDVFVATRWSISFSNWPINVSRIVTPIYINGEYIQAYEMEFGNLIEEIK